MTYTLKPLHFPVLKKKSRFVHIGASVASDVCETKRLYFVSEKILRSNMFLEHSFE